jgi:lipoprotein-anchoring transpeptidase ErfK/SrfK
MGSIALCSVVSLMIFAAYGRGIPPNTYTLGIDLGGLSASEAADRLRSDWQVITLIDPETEQTWNVDPSQLGITLDPEATAQRADQARGFEALLRPITIEPVLMIDLDAMQNGLDSLRADLETPARNAGIQVINGAIEATPPINGRALDLDVTLAPLYENAAQALSDGHLMLVMFSTQPAITDSGPLIAQVGSLLLNQLTVRVFDPVTGDSVYWAEVPETWGSWLTLTPDPAHPTGFRLDLDTMQTRAFLERQAAANLDDTRYLDYDRAVSALQAAIIAGQTETMIRVYHRDRTHTVQAGETIISIAWDYGVPYPWVERANPGVSTLTIGQTLTIPSPDQFFPFEPIPDKRIEVSLSEQRTRVYENGALKWDWGSSTGIASSPTWPGVYQVLLREENAYAGNWNLWMPYFIGVYQPVPNAAFTNGFHGFPTRGGGQLLWQNSIGTRVTYGCILLNNTNAQLLYNWVENGVIVEILR